MQSKRPLELIKFPQTLRLLLKDEAIGGKLILVAAILALVIANSPWQAGYESFWNTKLAVGLNDWVINLDLRHWVSEGLMAIFFLVVGLEIKREIVKGQLRRFKTAVLPVGAAVGGMVVPALIFVAINATQPQNLQGWAIPMATDIAFALGVMSLLGRRIPSSLRVFLLTLAIADDLGAITVIGLFYGSGINAVPLIIAFALLALLMLIRHTKAMSLTLFTIGAIAVWVAVQKSGVHPSIAGALVAFVAPLSSHEWIAERLERLTIPVSTFIVVPLFAFASVGIDLAASSFAGTGTQLLSAGIIAGLLVGKVLGITLFAWALVRFGIAELPEGSHWLQIVGVGLLAGIGFTVSIFITDLAFPGNQQLEDVAKLSIVAASTVSAVLGYVFLRYRKRIVRLLGRPSEA